MAFPTIVHNASTGSDSAASGAGPGDGTTSGVAVTGTAAAHTGGSASATITLSNAPDLSNVLTDGSHCLWLKTASGRQFSKITAKGTGSLTVEDSFTIASGSAVNYAIGGKRATFGNADSRLLFSADFKPGWAVATETDQSVSSALAVSVAGNTTTGFIMIRGTSASPAPKIIQSANAACFTLNATGLIFENLSFQNSNASKTGAYGLDLEGGSVNLVLRNVELGDATNQLKHGLVRGAGSPPSVIMIGGSVHHCTSDGINEVGGTSSIACILDGVSIYSNAGVGARVSFPAAIVVRSCEVYANGQEGLLLATANVAAVVLDGNTIHGNGTSGSYSGAKVQLAGAAAGAVVLNNNFTANTQYGLSLPAGSDAWKAFQDYNNFGAGSTANTSGAVSGATQGAHALNADPSYANASAGDFTPGNTALQAGYP